MQLSADAYEQIIKSLKSDPRRDSDQRRSPRVGVRSQVTALLKQLR